MEVMDQIKSVVERYMASEGASAPRLVDAVASHFKIRVPSDAKYPDSYLYEQLERATGISMFTWGNVDTIEEAVRDDLGADWAANTAGLMLLHETGQYEMVRKQSTKEQSA